MEPIAFVKLSGSGNDFICIDNRDGRYDELIRSGQAARLARWLCRRGLAVGADGVIFAEKTDLGDDIDIFARFYEPDGSETELCGNGAACMTYWALWRQWPAGQQVRLLTTAGAVQGRRVDGRYVRVCIPLPEDMQRDIDLDIDGRRIRCDFLVAGVPHAVTYVDDVEATDVARLGPLIRRHPRFGPRGANANFVQVLGEGRIALRTYEFGVENETLACGTGSTAGAILAAVRFRWSSQYTQGRQPVLVTARSGEVLRVHFRLRPDGGFDDVCLDTAVRCVYTGQLCPELLAEALSDPPG